MPDATAKRALHRALNEQEDLVLLYQPIHHANSGVVWAAEALLRQRRQDGELRDASIIHETAEESHGSELFALDHILVRKAYTDAAQWQAAHPDVRLNINLSPREFQQGHVIDRLTSLVTSCGTDTRKVNIEITETSFIAHPEETVNVLQAIRELGVGLWLDDFGTGHSSLAHLQHFPLDGVKLPGAFVRPFPGDARCRAIVRSILALAHDLGMAVIAEEVEREDQLDALRELHCEYIQGFLFSRPMEPDAFLSLLSSRHPSNHR